jgi:hypothetical protein
VGAEVSVRGPGYNAAVAEPPRDEFPNNFVGNLVHDERGWVVVPPTYCPDGHGYDDSLPHIRRGQVKCRIVASGLSVGGCATLKPSTPNFGSWPRWSIREHGGEPSSRQVDELLDERLEISASSVR